MTAFLVFITGLAAYFMSPITFVSLAMFPVLGWYIGNLISKELTQSTAESSVPRVLHLPPKVANAAPYLQDGSAASQIDHISWDELPELMNRLPYNTWFHKSFTWDRERWRFDFECRAASGKFSASTLGKTPIEAFTLAKEIVLKQVHDWHRTRFESGAETGVVPEYGSKKPTVSAPRVLIIDDDVDLALALREAFSQLGCETEIATRYEDLHRKITFSDADFILMDWQLNDKVTADKVVLRATRLIDTFADLRRKFTENRPRVITYSVLSRGQVALPTTSGEYFDHLDHWQKPMPFPEVIERASGLLAAH